MQFIKKILFLFIFLSGIFTQANAQDLPEPLNPRRIVNDYAGILDNNEANHLEQKLRQFSNSTKTQIAVVIVNNLNGYDKAKFAYSLGEKWKVGQKGLDNGIVVLVKPKTLTSKGEAFIAPGYGLEGVIPDAIAKRIVEHEMIPEFKRDNYYMGLEKGTNTLMALALGEFSASDYKKQTSSKPIGLLIPIIFIALVLIIMRKGQTNAYSAGNSNLPLMTALLLMMGSGSRRSSGNWDNFSSGGGGFGGGDSFGGFGGGSFGGGGAGGSW